MRLGEMEKDEVVCQGASAILKERLFEQSDYFQMPVCTRCGLIASSDRKDFELVKPEITCFNCRQSDKIYPNMPIPYPFKLLIQECMAMNCLIRLVFEDNKVVGYKIEED